MNELIPSFFVGISQTIIGHPFDTIKVLIQNKQKWMGLPLKQYYYGWKYPLISSAIFNCTVFPVYESSLKYTNNTIISGMIAGTLVTPPVYFFDIFKINEQVKKPISLKIFKNPYYGSIMTFNREVIAMGSYFGSYYYFKDEKKYGILLSGALSGLTNWTLTYPLDVIRSRQIAQNINVMNAYKQGKLWGGFSTCAFRAVLVNSSSFYIYEFLKKYNKEK